MANICIQQLNLSKIPPNKCILSPWKIRFLFHLLFLSPKDTQFFPYSWSSKPPCFFTTCQEILLVLSKCLLSPPQSSFPSHISKSSYYACAIILIHPCASVSPPFQISLHQTPSPCKAFPLKQWIKCMCFLCPSRYSIVRLTSHFSRSLCSNGNHLLLRETACATLPKTLLPGQG